jgi:Zn-dependent protease
MNLQKCFNLLSFLAIDGEKILSQLLFWTFFGFAKSTKRLGGLEKVLTQR